jgi:4-hydroxy-tetrahydrodipicolinate synthase
MSIFTGSAVAIITPFNEEGINFKKLEELIDFQIKGKTDGIVLAGTTGESPTIEENELFELFQRGIKYINKRVPVICGVGTNCTSTVIRRAKKAYELGADALLIANPYYNKSSNDGLIAHYQAISDAVPLPIIVYNVPSRTGKNIPAALMNKLADIENVAAVKEASGNISQICDVIDLCGDRIDVYSGNDDQILAITALGGKGVISTSANMEPELNHDIVIEFMNGNICKARELQFRLNKLHHPLFADANPIPLKTAMNMVGFEVGPLRLPLIELTGKAREDLAHALIDFGYDLVHR